MSGCQSTFCYTKSFSRIPYVGIKLLSELHNANGVDDGKRETTMKRAADVYCSHQIKKNSDSIPLVLVPNGQN